MRGVIHFANGNQPLCWTRTLRPRLTDNTHAVKCLNCRKRMGRLDLEREEAEATRRFDERGHVAAEAVGLDSVLDFLATQGDTAYVRMVSGLLGSVAIYLEEMGYTRPETSAAA